MLGVLGTYPLSDGSEYDLEELARDSVILQEASSSSSSSYTPGLPSSSSWYSSDEEFAEAAFIEYTSDSKEKTCVVCKHQKENEVLMQVLMYRDYFSSYVVYQRKLPHLVTPLFPRPFSICKGVIITHKDVICDACSPDLVFKDWNAHEAEEIRKFREGKGSRRQRRRWRQQRHSTCFKFVVEQNTPEWMLLRYGPDLLRIGSSAAGAALGVSHYGGPKSLAESILGRYKTAGGEPLVRYRDAQMPTRYTEYGHFYEDYVVRLVELLCPRYRIKDGGICVSTHNSTSRLRFAVSVDGEVYNVDDDPKCKKMVAVFEAKSAYYVGHHEQALGERGVMDRRTGVYMADKRSNHAWYNPNASDGIKAEHMAQIHLQMFVRRAQFAIYCTVEWVHWTPPHKDYKIPPFKSMKLIKVPFSKAYWKWAYPRLLKFTDSLRGWNDEPLPATNEPLASSFDSPPHVRGITDLVNGVGNEDCRRLYETVKSELDLYRRATANDACYSQRKIEKEWSDAELAGQVPRYNRWW